LPGLCSCQYRSEGAKTVRNGSAQPRPARAISGNSMSESQRRAARLDEVTVRRAHRISVNTTRFDPRSPSPFNGVVEADHDRLVVGDEGIDKQAEQAA
jgi:hypothetical protein